MLKPFNSKGQYKTRVAGIQTPAHVAWHNMTQRCLSKTVHENLPTYSECELYYEWADFQVFASWWTNQVGSDCGWVLDKDILKQGNKTYSPDTCVLVPAEVNALFVRSRPRRGKHPVGVCYNKSNNNFTSSCKVDNKSVHIGSYATESAAFEAYRLFKESLIKSVANKYVATLPKAVYDVLLNHKVSDYKE